MKASFEAKHLEFDFLLGDESYKFLYATHSRVVGPVGTPAMREQLLVELKAQAKGWLQRSPRAFELAKSLRKRVRGY
jgi:CelD/BcsL family acetyltransferase involved in cellulose biosynthesis